MQPKRQPGPIRRTIIVPPAPSARPASNPLLRAQTVSPPAKRVRRSRAVKMTGAQRDSNGNRSDWSKPQSLRPFTTPMMPAWSRTSADFDTAQSAAGTAAIYDYR